MGVLLSFPISDTIAAITAGIVMTKEMKNVRKMMIEQEKLQREEILQDEVVI